MRLRFEWDEGKNLANQQKHGISFEEALVVFYDPFVVQVQDRVVDGEERWHAIGVAIGEFLLMVVHTSQEEQFTELIRIISARAADAKERQRYEIENR